MKRPFMLILLVTLFALGLRSDQSHITLSLISSAPGGIAEVFFKTTPNIAVDISGNIYALDNRTSELYFINQSAHSVKTIARQGQGPGELETPTHLAIDKDRIYVRDGFGISIFNKEGIFVNRFRMFYPVIDLAVDNERIYIAQAGSPDLINVYDLKGNKLLSFGSKYTVDYELYKPWSPQFTDQAINNGKILFSPRAIYFVSTIFADLFTFERNGRLVSRKKLVSDDQVRGIEDIFFRIGLTDKNKHGYGYFSDITYFNKKFYGFVLRRIFRQSPGDILAIREDDLQIDATYGFPQEEISNDLRLTNISVRRGADGQPEFYLSYYDNKKIEFLISLFK